MKIAVSSTGQTLESTVEARFGRCPYFLMVNPATLEFEAIANTNAELGGGAGIQSAELIAEKGASVVLTGSCGPNALQVLEKAGIKVVTGVAGVGGGTAIHGRVAETGLIGSDFAELIRNNWPWCGRRWRSWHRRRWTRHGGRRPRSWHRRRWTRHGGRWTVQIAHNNI